MIIIATPDMVAPIILKEEIMQLETPATIAQKDEIELLQIYRKAKALKYADINVSIQEGARVKLWLTEKMK